MNESQLRLLTAYLSEALSYLHENNFVYRDLKPENILLSLDGKPKLADFGLSKYLTEDNMSNTFCGTPFYMSPEMILEKGTGREGDWWSLGAVLFECINGLPPFYHSDVQKVYRSTVKKKLKWKNATISPEGKDFISRLLSKYKETRLGREGMEEIKKHPWFESFDWSLL